MTIEELVALQCEEGSGHIHLVWIGPNKWVIAHTQDERDEGLEVMVDCELNDWLESFVEQPAPTGIYAALEDFWEGWELIPFDASPMV
jgi:hypothetical protein